LWWGPLHAKISDFGLKAGIGGFHPPRKQLAGKACNGVLHIYSGLFVEHRRKAPAKIIKCCFAGVGLFL